MRLYEKEVTIPVLPDHKGLLSHIDQALPFRLTHGASALRFVVTETDAEHYNCEIGVIAEDGDGAAGCPESIFRFVHRGDENVDCFNTMLLVPTGIGAEIGGHAGDATPAARVIAEACDVLITHPNVVNASDVNEIPENALYVEGSVISRLLMGTVGLQRVRANRVLVIIDAHRDELFVNAAINSVSAARASYGLHCPRIVQLDPLLKMTSRYASSGRAAGVIEGLDRICAVLDKYRGEFDAVAISSVIDVPPEFHMEYAQSGGEMINPWGGVEAMLTHAISSLYDVPSAHSPMFENREIANLDTGVVEPRMAAETVSVAFLQCILKGLQRSPRIVTDTDTMLHHGVVTAADVSCLIIPDGCLGLPTLAALAQGIPVIAVRENRNVMRNDLTAFPWRPGQLHIVENYWEAVGVMTAIKAGIAPESLRRPLAATMVVKKALGTPSLGPTKAVSVASE